MPNSAKRPAENAGKNFNNFVWFFYAIATYTIISIWRGSILINLSENVICSGKVFPRTNAKPWEKCNHRETDYLDYVQGIIAVHYV